MFKFEFDVESEGEEEQECVKGDESAAVARKRPAVASTSSREAGPSTEIALSDLLAALPDVISYSPLPHPLGRQPLLRRDLFDARFQLALGESSAKADGSATYVDADTDLIPGTYEGGLKSWEGGVDLVEVLARSVGSGSAEGGSEEEKVGAWAAGARVLEVGCGTGLPTAYLLRALLQADGRAKTTLHVQDYNLPVLSLVTLPNLILAAIPFLPLSAQLAAETAPAQLERVASAEDLGETEPDEEEEEEAETHRPFDPERAGSLELSQSVLDAFTRLMEERGIELRFTYGDWGGMAQSLEGERRYDLVLTAETIYAEESLGALTDVLVASTRREEQKRVQEEKNESLEDSLGALDVRDDWAQGRLVEGDPVVLVAAKVLYFGVGGGLDAFIAQVHALGGYTTRVRDWVKGVGRAVVRVGW